MTDGYITFRQAAYSLGVRTSVFLSGNEKILDIRSPTNGILEIAIISNTSSTNTGGMTDIVVLPMYGSLNSVVKEGEEAEFICTIEGSPVLYSHPRPMQLATGFVTGGTNVSVEIPSQTPEVLQIIPTPPTYAFLIYNKQAELSGSEHIVTRKNKSLIRRNKIT